MEADMRIDKTVTLQAPLSRVWRALTDAREFGQWFGVQLIGPFVEGQPVAATFEQAFDSIVLFGEGLHG